MADQQQLKDAIEQLLKGSVQKQLLQNYPSRSFDGTPKPINKSYPTPFGNKIASSQLYNSVDVFFDTDLEDGQAQLILDFGSADYWYWVNYGRRPSVRMPNISDIREWISQKGALDTGGNLSIEQRTFLVARSIQQYGTYKTDFINKAFNEVQRDLNDLFGQYAVEYFREVVRKGVIAEWEKQFKYDTKEKALTITIALD
jgi:hypothetical protein